MIVAGIGCRHGSNAADVQAALDAALERFMPSGRVLSLIAAPVSKGGEPGIAIAAAARGVALRLICQTALEAAAARTLTYSRHALAALNVPSVAEAAALAGAGPHAKLLGARVAVGSVTCALAESPPAA